MRKSNFNFFLQKSVRSNFYKFFPRQSIFRKSTFLSNFCFKDFCVRGLHLALHDILFLLLFNWKCSFEKEGVTFDKSVWSKSCLKLSISESNKIRSYGFLKKKIKNLIFVMSPTKDYFFLIFCYGFTSTLQPYQPWHCVMPNLLNLF